MTVTVTAVGQTDGEVLFVDTEEGVWKDPTTAIPVVTNAVPGLMAAAEHTKLGGIEAGAVAAGATGDAFSTSHLSAFDHTKIATALQPGDVDDAPVNGATTAPVSSNWAYDHVAAVDPHPGYAIEAIRVAVGDETTALTTGAAKATFRMPFALTITGVRASVTTAPTGTSLLTVDINDGGVSILSTKLTFDAGEKTTTTATTAVVISDTALADDAEITVDIDQVGSTVAGAGLKVTIIGGRL
jgi:hypothetical protein